MYVIFSKNRFLSGEFCLIEKLEIEKYKLNIVISVLKVDIAIARTVYQKGIGSWFSCSYSALAQFSLKLVVYRDPPQHWPL